MIKVGVNFLTECFATVCLLWQRCVLCLVYDFWKTIFKTNTSYRAFS